MNQSEQLVHDFMDKIEDGDLYKAYRHVSRVTHQDSGEIREFTMVHLRRAIDKSSATETNSLAYLVKNEVISTGGKTNE